MSYIPPNLLYVFTGIFIVAANLASISLITRERPEISNVQIVTAVEASDQPLSFPLLFQPARQDGSTQASIHFSLDVPHDSRRSYSMYVTDCIRGITVNNAVVESSKIPFCNNIEAVDIDLGSYLHDGRNSVQVEVTSNEPLLRFDITEVRRFSHEVFGRFVSAGSVLILLIIVGYWFGASVPGAIGTTILLAGVFLRSWYVTGTHVYLRSYDTPGHVQYLEYVLNEVAMPGLAHGWQTYHPPFYYALAALWSSLLGRLIGMGDMPQLIYQHLSLLLSTFSLYFCYLLSILLFRDANTGTDMNSKKYLSDIFLAACVTFPALVYPASQIGNDALILPLMLGILYQLQRWWLEPTNRRWIVLLITLVAAILTKGNALILVGVVALTCIFHISLNWRSKIISLLLLVLLLVLGAGWFFYIRFFHQHQSHLIGNVRALHPVLEVSTELKSLATFHPGEVFHKPYLHPWEEGELSRKHFFLEYLFQSALFGEFDHGEKFIVHARVLIVFFLMIVVLAIVSLAERLIFRNWSEFPLLIAAGAGMAASLVVRISAPYVSTQDFRYIAYTSPILLFLALTNRLPKGRYVATFALCGFSLVSTIFFLQLTAP